MSKYTTDIRFICETAAGLTESKGYNNVNEIIESARPKIFNFSYPIFDDEYKPTLETKILKHFYLREISSETVGVWKLWLDATMNEIMPYYNELYKSTLIEFNPLYDTDITTESQRDIDGSENKTGSEQTSSTRGINESSQLTDETTIDGTTSSQTAGTKTGSQSGTSGKTGSGTTAETTQNSGSQTTDTLNEFSDTPQGGLDGILSHDYLTNATKETGTGASMTSGLTSGTTSSTESGSTSLDTEETTSTATGEIRGETQNKEQDTTKTTAETNAGMRSNLDTAVSTSTDQYLEHVYGKRGGATFMSMIKELRENIINIDMMIIEELEPLFMQLW